MSTRVSRVGMTEANVSDVNSGKLRFTAPRFCATGKSFGDMSNARDSALSLRQPTVPMIDLSSHLLCQTSTWESVIALSSVARVVS